MDEQRERLIKLLEEAQIKTAEHFRGVTKMMLAKKGRFNSKTDIDVAIYEIQADHLLENGVIVPPCEVKDKYVMDSAKAIFESWNDVTGVVPKHTSWYYEMECVIEDIVKLSFGAGVSYKEEEAKGGGTLSINSVSRFLSDQHEIISVLVYAYHASEKGIVFVRQSTIFRAHVFKDMCASFLKNNNITKFKETKNSIQFEGRYKIVFDIASRAKNEGSGIYKVI